MIISFFVSNTAGKPQSTWQSMNSCLQTPRGVRELNLADGCMESNTGRYISYVCFNDAQDLSTFVFSNLGPDRVELGGVSSHLKDKRAIRISSHIFGKLS